ncbi:MAG TPA: phosphate signaling complex protein PhoU [Verrucomicrobiae bacterium]|jgi:phosphate transport system protein|nr:phosphate signaling complex protein PhoU [Verrucomicrobiae bacterium]
MARKEFDQELHDLEKRLQELGLMVEEALVEAVDALKRRDLEKAGQIITADRSVNERRYAIEHETFVLIATQQPMAVDLRTLAAVLEIATELERIGDYAKGIAKITIKMGTEPFVKPLIDIPRMAEKARNMLQRALQAFAGRDTDLARAIPAEDDEMDALYEQIFRELSTHIMVDPKLVDRASYLIWVAHNLERAADRVVNICERVIFMVTGEVVEFDDNL